MTGMTTRPRVQLGDVIVFSGTPHLVDSIEERTAFDCPIARSADGWGISLDPDGTLNIPSPNERWQHIPVGERTENGS